MGANLRAVKKGRVAGPIRDSRDIGRIRTILFDRPRDLLLFDLAVQTGAGMKKLLPLKVKALAGAKEGERIAIGTGRDRKDIITITETIEETFHRYMKETGPRPSDYIFKSKKGQGPLNLSTVSNMINGWFEAAGIKGCHGAISLRKTWEYNSKDNSPAKGRTLPQKPESIFKPIGKSTVQKTIFNELFKAIITHKIKPGARLTAAEISRDFKVSQAPVRVALNWLEARGFIISQKKSGSIVRELNIQELHEIIEVRLILETAAARLACRVFTEETLRQLESIAEGYKKAYTFEESDQLNRQFHRVLYQDVRMPLLTRIVMDLYDRFSPYAALATADQEDEPDVNIRKEGPAYYHNKILDGIRRRDVDHVVKYLEMKLRRGMLMTEEIMKKGEG